MNTTKTTVKASALKVGDSIVYENVTMTLATIIAIEPEESDLILTVQRDDSPLKGDEVCVGMDSSVIVPA